MSLRFAKPCTIQLKGSKTADILKNLQWLKNRRFRKADGSWKIEAGSRKWEAGIKTTRCYPFFGIVPFLVRLKNGSGKWEVRGGKTEDRLVSRCTQRTRVDARAREVCFKFKVQSSRSIEQEVNLLLSA